MNNLCESSEESCASRITKFSPEFPFSYSVKTIGSFLLTEGFNRISFSNIFVSNYSLIVYETTTPGLIAIIDDKTSFSDYYLNNNNKTKKIESNKNYKFCIKAMVYENFYFTRTEYIQRQASIGLYSLNISSSDFIIKTKSYKITNGELNSYFIFL